MPDPNKKISATEPPCQAKLAKSGSAGAKPAKKSKDKDVKECKSSPKEDQAVLNKEPCPPGPACHAARPDLDSATSGRIDKSKPGCINFECEEKPPPVKPGCGVPPKEVRTLSNDCIDYEDCTDFGIKKKEKPKELECAKNKPRNE